MKILVAFLLMSSFAAAAPKSVWPPDGSVRAQRILIQQVQAKMEAQMWAQIHRQQASKSRLKARAKPQAAHK